MNKFALIKSFFCLMIFFDVCADYSEELVFEASKLYFGSISEYYDTTVITFVYSDEKDVTYQYFYDKENDNYWGEVYQGQPPYKGYYIDLDSFYEIKIIVQLWLELQSSFCPMDVLD